MVDEDVLRLRSGFCPEVPFNVSVLTVTVPPRSCGSIRPVANREAEGYTLYMCRMRTGSVIDLSVPQRLTEAQRQVGDELDEGQGASGMSQIRWTFLPTTRRCDSGPSVGDAQARKVGLWPASRWETPGLG